MWGFAHPCPSIPEETDVVSFSIAIKASNKGAHFAVPLIGNPVCTAEAAPMAPPADFLAEAEVLRLLVANGCAFVATLFRREAIFTETTDVVNAVTELAHGTKLD